MKWHCGRQRCAVHSHSDRIGALPRRALGPHAAQFERQRASHRRHSVAADASASSDTATTSATTTTVATTAVHVRADVGEQCEKHWSSLQCRVHLGGKGGARPCVVHIGSAQRRKLVRTAVRTAIGVATVAVRVARVLRTAHIERTHDKRTHVFAVARRRIGIRMQQCLLFAQQRLVLYVHIDVCDNVVHAIRARALQCVAESPLDVEQRAPVPEARRVRGCARNRLCKCAMCEPTVAQQRHATHARRQLGVAAVAAAATEHAAKHAGTTAAGAGADRAANAVMRLERVCSAKRCELGRRDVVRRVRLLTSVRE